MVVSGLPLRNGLKHAQEIGNMSIDLLKFVQTFEVQFNPSYKLKLRIGIHSGSCAAGKKHVKIRSINLD
jgi:atrial natriuretic peptide receptor A